MKRAKVTAILGAALIGAVGIGTTFAYLTSQTGTVTNTFTVGNVDFDKVAGLKESAVERENGVYVDKDGENQWTSDGNTYEDLYAGETILKDPTVRLEEGSQDAWVYAMITIDNADAFSAVDYSADWVDVTEAYHALHETDGNYAVYARVNGLSAETPSTIFNSVTVDKSVTSETEMGNISVKACAVQMAGFDTYMDALGEAVFE